MSIRTSAEVGQRLRSIAFLIGRIVALLWVAAEATYRAGYRTGQFVHNLNDRLVGVVARFNPHVPSDEELMQLWGSEFLTSDALDSLIEGWEMSYPEGEIVYSSLIAESEGVEAAVK